MQNAKRDFRTTAGFWWFCFLLMLELGAEPRCPRHAEPASTAPGLRHLAPVVADAARAAPVAKSQLGDGRTIRDHRRGLGRFSLHGRMFLGPERVGSTSHPRGAVSVYRVPAG